MAFSFSKTIQGLLEYFKIKAVSRPASTKPYY